MLRDARPRQRRASSPSATSVGGQDELIFDGHSLVLDDEGEVLARAPGFEEALLVVDLDPTDGDRPAAARRRAGGRSARELPVAARGDRDRGSRRREPGRDRRPRRAGAVRRAARADAARARARAAATTSQERLRRRRARRLRRDRLGAHRRARGRGARRRPRPLRLDAVALLLRGHARATRGGSPRTSAATSASCRSSRSSRRSTARSRRVRGPRAGCRRGEPPGADPRHAADGALEQVRLAARRDRQQVGDCRSATRRSTATWPAASRCSRTCSRRTCSGSRGT